MTGLGGHRLVRIQVHEEGSGFQEVHPDNICRSCAVKGAEQRGRCPATQSA